jgi:VWFA-related protein
VLIILDDLSFGPHAYDRTRRSLQRMVESLDPKDRVDIVTTSAGFERLVLTTDRQANRDAIAAMRRTPWTRAELADLSSRETALLSQHGLRYDGSVFDTVDDWMALRSIAAVKNAVKVLRDVPGRKAVLLVSEGFENLSRLTLPQVKYIYWPLDRLYGDANDLFGALRRLAELAARSGVVIDAVDPRGLVTAGLGVEASIQDIRDVRAYGNAVSAQHLSLYRAQATLQYLTDETGGLTRLDGNDMDASLASIMDDLSGYYLIGYTPRSGTFDASRFHRFEVKVKRPGLKVRTREGFYPVTDEQVATALE